ncbi:spore germination protein [Salibacterium aidingense]|uniref:spore germination protein n=1 Tax=Salibacterium aidingense TaxID=384933 RepID=UPI000417CF80|nr:spore germination protein [Salibacterium aidingense]
MNLFRRKRQYRAAPSSKRVSAWLREISENSKDVSAELVETPFGVLTLYYVDDLINTERLNMDALRPLKKNPWTSYSDIERIIYSDTIKRTTDIQEINERLFTGSVVCQLPSAPDEVLMLEVPTNVQRDISIPETEFSVVGPREAFVEKLETNVFLIRKRLPIEDFRVKNITIGELSKTKTSVFYIDSIADKANVNTVIQRIKDVEYDEILGSNALSQMIQDHSFTIFPAFVNTERPDRAAAALAEGKVVFMCDGSPEAIIAPSTLVEFFTSLEDYYLPWHIASFVRLLRLISVTFSIIATPVYVAVLTFHYEMIPKDLLSTLIASRSNIPFPPLIEAIFLEFTIELLREAGARLPTKVGQTIGIVGGIVIGQASVEAGLTSNVLLIVVALAALASFTSPVYQMGNTIRIIRFPFMIGAALMGGIGIAISFVFVVTHLIRLESLGRPYFAPFFPLRISDWRDTFVRLPFNVLYKRPHQSRAAYRQKLPAEKIGKKKDIDE